MGRIQVNVLGPWEVLSGSTHVPVPPGHLRSLLSALVLTPDQPVRADTLAGRLWGEHPPVNVRGTLSTYVTRLRRLLGADIIASHPGGGYSFAVDKDDVDLHRFRRLLREARATAEAEQELDLVNQALAQWRGRPFTGVESGWLERDVVPALTEEWFTATEQRLDLDLARGSAGELIAELWQLTNTYPLRESLWVRLIGVLNRSGRRADALTAYQRIRTILRDQLGVDPGTSSADCTWTCCATAPKSQRPAAPPGRTSFPTATPGSSAGATTSPPSTGCCPPVRQASRR
jgi:DNA-binding SARP family transcriptional activator